MITTVRAALAAVALAALAAGCGKSEPTPEGPTARELLYELSDVYSSSELQLKRPPARLPDLNAGRRAGSGRAIPAVERGDLAVVWGTKFIPPGSTPSPAVLAYEKDAPTRGGWVLFQDSSVKELSAADVAAALKAAH